VLSVSRFGGIFTPKKNILILWYKNFFIWLIFFKFVIQNQRMKYYTQIRGEVKDVKIISTNSNNSNIVKVEAWDFTDGRLEAFRVKSELFINKAKAEKYFK